MKNNTIFTIFKKELARFFKDKRTLIALLLPGVLLYVVYSLMGGAMSNAFMPDEDIKPKIITVNMPQSITPLFSEAFEIIDESTESETENKKELFKNGECDLIIVFPKDFVEKLGSPEGVPNIDVFFNSSSTNSSTAYQMAVALLDAFESSISNVFDINTGGESYDLASEDDLAAMIISMVMPMLENQP